jgi:3-oxoacyl-[acyl-carrier protein] reductase
MSGPAKFDLKDRVALVTGASRGIGRGVALGLGRAGAAVAVNYVSNQAAAEEVVRQITSFGGRAVAIRGDVGDLAQHQRLVNGAAETFGRLDILVNNAAIARNQPVLKATPEEWDLVMGVNLRGAYFLAQAAARLMAQQHSGKIVNLSSVQGERPRAGNSIYGITKAALVTMTKCLALELAEFGIQVNAISPGAILTDENRERLADDQYRAKILARIPCGRIGSPEHVVDTLLFLVSPGADYVTGSVVCVDGGMRL